MLKARLRSGGVRAAKKMDIKRDADRLKISAFAPRTSPTAIPQTTLNEMPTRCIEINAEWASHVIGALEVLAQPDTWAGTDAEIEAAIQIILELQNQLSLECV
jgi:hypothetical protein